MTPIHTLPSSEELLEGVRKKYGFVPNILRELGRSPAALFTYLKGQEALAASSLADRDLQAVQLAVSVANGCPYCTAAHGALAVMMGLPEDEEEAIRRGELPLAEPLRTLVQATWLLHETRGRLKEAEVERFARAGLDRARLYELVTVLAVKTITNYVDHITPCRLDPQLGGPPAA